MRKYSITKKRIMETVLFGAVEIELLSRMRIDKSLTSVRFKKDKDKAFTLTSNLTSISDFVIWSNELVEVRFDTKKLRADLKKLANKK